MSYVDAHLNDEEYPDSDDEYDSDADFIVDTTCTWCSIWAYADIDPYIIETDETDNVAGPLTVESP